MNRDIRSFFEKTHTNILENVGMCFNRPGLN